MSGAVAAHASYNGSGTQGLAVTNKISDSTAGDVVSVFWNDTDTSRQLLYGSSTLEIPTSGSGKNASWGGSQIFTVNNDIDCLGDLYLSLTVEMNKPATALDAVVRTSTVDSTRGSHGIAAVGAGVALSASGVTGHEIRAPDGGTGGAAADKGTGGAKNAADLLSAIITATGFMYFLPDSTTGLYVLNGTPTGSSSNARQLTANLFIDEIKDLVDYYNNETGYAIPTTGAINVPALNASYQRAAGVSLRMTMNDAFAAVKAAQIAEEFTVLDDYVNFPNVKEGETRATEATPFEKFFETVPDQAVRYDVASNNQNASNPFWASSTLKSKVKFPLANIIKRVEFQVGTQIWQTLEYNDLLSINATELSESSYDRLGLQTSGFVRSDGERESTGKPYWVPGAKYQAFIPLPMLTKSLGPQLENFTQNSEDGFLMAAAPHQNVKVKVHYSTFADVFETAGVAANQGFIADIVDNAGTVSGRGEYITNSYVSWAPDATLSTKLYGQHMIMCNEEREQMKKMPNGIPKRLKMTQNVNQTFPATIYPDQAITVDLDHYSLYASHLIISATFPGRGGIGQKVAPTLKYAELKLNSSSFSGQLDGQLLKGITNKSLGLYANDFNLDNQELDSGMGYYVFPIAARAFGGSAVPLNRFDNIRLVLTFTHPDITAAGHSVDRGTINVTCCGETTGLYKAGAASLAMY